MTELLAGLLVSLVVQAIKHLLPNLARFWVYVLVVGLSLLAALVHFLLVHLGYWEGVLYILTAAAGIHNLIWRRLEADDGS